MTTPSDHDDESGRSASADGRDEPAIDRSAADEVDLGKKPADEPFDPYRFGKPDHPVPPEYAPPGYVPDPTPAAAYPPPPGAPGGPYPYGAPPYPQNPYPPNQAPPGQYPPYPSNPYPYGQTPSYGQAPYPVPPYQQRSNGRATTAMVLGILALALCWLSFLDAVLIIPAIVFGILGLTDAKARGGIGRNQAVAGLICAGLAAVLAITLTVFLFRAYDRCGGESQADEPGFEQCLQDRFFSERELS